MLSDTAPHAAVGGCNVRKVLTFWAPCPSAQSSIRTATSVQLRLSVQPRGLTCESVSNHHLNSLPKQPASQTHHLGTHLGGCRRGGGPDAGVSGGDVCRPAPLSVSLACPPGGRIGSDTGSDALRDPERQSPGRRAGAAGNRCSG